eukprot:scaffold269460_cov33-Tisochrysis_lutea.AAC.2
MVSPFLCVLGRWRPRRSRWSYHIAMASSHITFTIRPPALALNTWPSGCWWAPLRCRSKPPFHYGPITSYAHALG